MLSPSKKQTKMETKYIIKERIEYNGARSRTRHYAVYLTAENAAEKCITWDCPKKMAQQFIQATLGIQDANKVLVSLRKKAANFGGDILARIAAKDLANELDDFIKTK